MEKLDMTTFDRIKELAKKRKLTLSQVNELAGIGTNSIYRWKTQSPTVNNLKKVAKVLNTSTDYLLGNTNNQSPIKEEDQKDRLADIKNPKIKVLARKMDKKNLSDQQIKIIDETVSNFMDNLYNDDDGQNM